jgi:hypothetical protein
MVILLIVVVIFLVLLAGLLLAFLFSRLDRTVVRTREGMAAEERAYNPGLTLGHKIKVEADYDEQLRQARLEAAKKAAATPRGANVRIGHAGASNLSTAGKSAKQDPMTAVRIARFHGWDGARTGIPTGGAPMAVAGAMAAAPGVATAAAPAAAGIAPPTLIAITPDMPPEEVRKARIANSKAEAAYNKALKAAASGAPVAVAVPVPASPGIAPEAAPPAVNIAAPKLIEITPDMPPEEVRKARIANAKAEAAYNKALKAAGGVAGVASAQSAAVAAPDTVAQPAAAQPVAAAAPVAVAGIAPPQLIEITDSMPPEEVRRARVANAKAEAAYNKALKAAGVDPAAMKAGGAPVAAQPAAVEVPAAAPAAAPTAAPVAAAGPAIPAGIVPPQLIEITDSMSPDEIRQARVANAKASAAYNKALKAAGIDPASVK